MVGPEHDPEPSRVGFRRWQVFEISEVWRRGENHPAAFGRRPVATAATSTSARSAASIGTGPPLRRRTASRQHPPPLWTVPPRRHWPPVAPPAPASPSASVPASPSVPAAVLAALPITSASARAPPHPAPHPRHEVRPRSWRARLDDRPRQRPNAIASPTGGHRASAGSARPAPTASTPRIARAPR